MESLRKGEEEGRVWGRGRESLRKGGGEGV